MEKSAPRPIAVSLPAATRPGSADTKKQSPASNPDALYKTELCRSFEDNGSCRYGAKCRFAHGVEDLRHVVRHKKYKTEKCKNYVRDGHCPYGIRCRFMHDPDEDEILLSRSAPAVSTAHGSLAVLSASTATNVVSPLPSRLQSSASAGAHLTLAPGSPLYPSAAGISLQVSHGVSSPQDTRGVAGAGMRVGSVSLGSETLSLGTSRQRASSDELAAATLSPQHSRPGHPSQLPHHPFTASQSAQFLTSPQRLKGMREPPGATGLEDAMRAGSTNAQGARAALPVQRTHAGHGAINQARGLEGPHGLTGSDRDGKGASAFSPVPERSVRGFAPVSLSREHGQSENGTGLSSVQEIRSQQSSPATASPDYLPRGLIVPRSPSPPPLASPHSASALGVGQQSLRFLIADADGNQQPGDSQALPLRFGQKGSPTLGPIATPVPHAAGVVGPRSPFLSPVPVRPSPPLRSLSGSALSMGLPPLLSLDARDFVRPSLVGESDGQRGANEEVLAKASPLQLLGNRSPGLWQGHVEARASPLLHLGTTSGTLSPSAEVEQLASGLFASSLTRILAGLDSPVHEHMPLAGLSSPPPASSPAASSPRRESPTVAFTVHLPQQAATTATALFTASCTGADASARNHSAEAAWHMSRSRHVSVL